MKDKPFIFFNGINIFPKSQSDASVLLSSFFTLETLTASRDESRDWSLSNSNKDVA